jgi:hypothetical protein
MRSARESGGLDLAGAGVSLLIVAVVVAVTAAAFAQVEDDIQQRNEAIEAVADDVYGEGNWRWNQEDCGLSCEREPEPGPDAKTQADFDEVAPDSLSGRDGSPIGEYVIGAVLIGLIALIIGYGVRGGLPRSM